MESIVKVPSVAGDIDFLAFSFNGLHSWDDFGIIRTSDGNRYNDNLMPTMQDKTAEVPGGDGMYYFGTTHKQKDFSISFAFDNMSETTYRRMKQWLNGKEIGDLWFSEAPYKVYTAKPTGTPNIKSLCFEIDGQRVYKGEGSIQFVAYWPYAHTPDYVGGYNFYMRHGQPTVLEKPIKGKYFEFTSNADTFEIEIYPASGDNITLASSSGKASLVREIEISIMKIKANTDIVQIYTSTSQDGEYMPQLYLRNGKDFDSYSEFENRLQWQMTSGLTSGGEKCQGENPGDIPATFIVSSPQIGGGDEYKVGDITIEFEDRIGVFWKEVVWDSKTGIISALVTTNGITKRQPIPYIGNSLGTIPVSEEPFPDNKLELNNGTLKYHYWYY